MSAVLSNASVATPSAAPDLLLQGYDQFGDAIRSTAVAGAPNSEGGTFGVTYAVCTTLEEIHDALQVSTSLSYSGLSGSVDEKADFVNTLNVTRTGIYVVVYATATYGRWFLDGASIAPGITPPTNDTASLNAFYLQYGNAYVSEVTTGGWYAAVYSFQSTTIEQQTYYQAQLSANGVSLEGNFSADICASLSTMQSDSTVALSWTQRGAGLLSTNPLPGHAADIYTFASGINADLDPVKPAVLNYACASYIHVTGMPAAMSQFDDLYYLFSQEQGSYCERYSRLMGLSNWLVKVSAIFACYGYDGDTDLPDKIQAAEADLAAIQRFFFNITEAPLPAAKFPTLSSDAWGTPTLSILQAPAPIGYLGSGGVQGDQSNSDVSILNVGNLTRITQVNYTWGDTLNQLILSYVSEDQKSGSTYGTTPGDQNPPAPLTLQTGERISGITTLVDETTNVITITTSLGQTFNATGGNDEGTPNSWSETKNSRLVGFTGNYGWYVNQLQIVVAVFSPITWTPQ